MRIIKIYLVIIVITTLVITSFSNALTISEALKIANDEMDFTWNLKNHYKSSSEPEYDQETGNKTFEGHLMNEENINLLFNDKRPSIVYGVPHGDTDTEWKTRYRYLGYTKYNEEFSNYLFRDDPGGFKSSVIDVDWSNKPWEVKAIKKNFNIKEENVGKFSSPFLNHSIIGGLEKRYPEYPIEEQRKDLWDDEAGEQKFVEKNWVDFVYIIQPPTRTMWGYGVMSYRGNGGDRYQTIPIAPIPAEYDYAVEAVTAKPDPADSGKILTLEATITAKMEEEGQTPQYYLLGRAIVDNGGIYTFIVEPEEWQQVDGLIFKVNKSIKVTAPVIDVYGDMPTAASVEVNYPGDSGEYSLIEPTYDNNIAYCQFTTQNYPKTGKEVLKEGYIGWWEAFAVNVEWDYWVKKYKTVGSGKNKRRVSYWAGPYKGTAKRYYSGWNEAELDYVPLGYGGVKGEYIPYNKGTGKMKLLAPWASDSKSRTMFTGYNTMRSGYGFSTDILAQLKGTYRQPSNIHSAIADTIKLKLDTNFAKTAKNISMEKISTAEKAASSSEVNYNGVQTDIHGNNFQNKVLTSAGTSGSIKKTADRVASGNIYTYSNTTQQMWQMPKNPASKDNARKLYINIKEADGRYTITGVGSFNNTKGITTETQYNRKDKFNIGIYENMYHDLSPADKSVE